MKKFVMFIILSYLFLLVGCKVQTKQPQFNINQSFQTKFNNKAIDANNDFHRLFSEETKHHITIEMTRNEWNKLNQDMLQYANQYEDDLRSDAYFKANMIYTDSYGSITIEDIGFRTRGNNSRTLLQNEDGTYNLSHFKIKFNETFDYIEESKTYKMLDDRKVFDLEELTLKYNSNQDLSNISELHAHQLMNKVGVYAPLVTLTQLTIKIDNESIDYGVYSMIEPIDKEFIDKRFPKKQSNGNLYKCLALDLGTASLETLTKTNLIGIKNVKLNYRPTYDLKTNKKDPNYSDLKQFIDSINRLTNEEFKTYIENIFEIDSFLRLLAMNVLIGNADDYRGNGDNYYLYYNNLTNKFLMIPYDIDQSFGVDKSKFTMYSDIYNWRDNSILFKQDDLRPLSDKILSISDYQKTYEYYIREFMNSKNNIFSLNVFNKTYINYKNLYSHAVNFNDSYTKSFYTNKLNNINEQLQYYEFNPNKKQGDIS